MNNIVIIVCPTLRHQYTANTILNGVPISGIIRQHRIRKTKPTKQIRTEDENVAHEEHFYLRDEAEKRWFSKHGVRLLETGTDVLDIYNNKLDDPRILEFVKNKKTNILVTLGCSLVRNDVLNVVDYGLNFHLGMSPRYRGSAGLFWPIYNMDVARVAVSILVLEDNIDGGPIVHHSRPDIVSGDKIHDIACKTVISGANDFAKILKALYDGEELIAKPQKSNGRVHYESAYHPRNLRVADFLMENGLIDNYLNNKEDMDKNVSFTRCPYV